MSEYTLVFVGDYTTVVVIFATGSNETEAAKGARAANDYLDNDFRLIAAIPGHHKGIMTMPNHHCNGEDVF